MADSEQKEQPGIQETSLELRKLEIQNDLDDPVALAARVYQMWWNWADFHIHVISPHIDLIVPPTLIKPELLPHSDELEFVYPIHDSGSKLSTSKAEDMYSAGMSMCKLFYTIEKMIHILIERLKAGGVGPDVEVQVAFAGHELAQRKAFETIINLSYNLIVTNFDPGVWGERYLQSVKTLADKGFGYPAEAPRDTYRQSHGATSVSIKR